MGPPSHLEAIAINVHKLRNSCRPDQEPSSSASMIGPMMSIVRIKKLNHITREATENHPSSPAREAAEKNLSSPCQRILKPQTARHLQMETTKLGYMSLQQKLGYMSGARANPAH